jgi:toxin CptA
MIPWPEQDWPAWLILVALIGLESLLTQRRINKSKGLLTLLDKRTIHWQEEKWNIIRSPFILSFGIFLTLKSESSKAKKHLWIAADSMSKEQWRSLRYELQGHSG